MTLRLYMDMREVKGHGFETIDRYVGVALRLKTEMWAWL